MRRFRGTSKLIRFFSFHVSFSFGFPIGFYLANQQVVAFLSLCSVFPKVRQFRRTFKLTHLRGVKNSLLKDSAKVLLFVQKNKYI